MARGQASAENGKKGGRPKGRKNDATLTKEQAREALRVVVLKHMEAMTAAQIANAQGLKYLVTRDKKTGKFLRVTQAMARLKEGEELVEVWEKDPSVQAFTDLMNRALDKPKEQEIDVTVKRVADETDDALLARAAVLLAKAKA